MSQSFDDFQHANVGYADDARVIPIPQQEEPGFPESLDIPDTSDNDTLEQED